MARSAMVLLVVAALVVSACGSQTTFALRGDQQLRVIREGNGSNEGPVSVGRWFAWMNSSRPNPIPPLSHTVVYAKKKGQAAWQVNPAGTFAETGGMSGNKLAIQLIDHQSKIALVDLATRKLTVMPQSINPETGAVEWKPSISGKWLLFGRIYYGKLLYKIMLADLTENRVFTLDATRGHGAYAAPGQISGHFATWISCPDNHCRAYRENISSRKLIPMPLLGGPFYWQFGPSVARDGTVYFGVAHGCADVRLVRWRNGSVTTVYRLPPGTAFQYSWVSDGRSPIIYIDEVKCDTRALSRIVAIRDTTK